MILFSKRLFDAAEMLHTCEDDLFHMMPRPICLHYTKMIVRLSRSRAEQIYSFKVFILRNGLLAFVAG